MSRVGLTPKCSLWRFECEASAGRDDYRNVPRRSQNDPVGTTASDMSRPAPSKCSARGERVHVGGHVVPSWAFTSLVGLTTSSPPPVLAVSLQQVGKPRGLNATCKLRRDRVCTAAADMRRPAHRSDQHAAHVGGHVVVPPWAFASRVGLTTRFFVVAI